MMRSRFNPGCRGLDSKIASAFASFFRNGMSDWNASKSCRNFLLGIRFGILHVLNKPCGKLPGAALAPFVEFCTTCFTDFDIAVN